jgi:hypothetical protein
MNRNPNPPLRAQAARRAQKKGLHRAVQPFPILYGSPTRARTWDLRINSPSLYRLSYRGILRVIMVMAGPALVNRTRPGSGSQQARLILPCFAAEAISRIASSHTRRRSLGRIGTIDPDVIPSAHRRGARRTLAKKSAARSCAVSSSPQGEGVWRRQHEAVTRPGRSPRRRRVTPASSTRVEADELPARRPPKARNLPR